MVNAASGGLLIHFKSNGSSIFRDGLRLVLSLFFAFAALWAQVAFIASTINISATSACQVALIFSTAFDQLARVSVEQFLLWTIARTQAGKMTTGQLIPQFLLVGRVVAGGVFVGFTRGGFNPVCVPMSSLLPVSILVIALDAIIIAALAVRAFSSGMYDHVREGKSDAGRSKAVLLGILGLAVWTASSIPMLLGMDQTDLILKTAIPSAGLLTLLALVIITVGNVIQKKGKPSDYPEAPSPRNINSSRDISTSDSAYPPINYEDVKSGIIRAHTSTFLMPRELPNVAGLPNAPKTDTVAVAGAMTPGGLARSATKASIRRNGSQGTSRKGVGRFNISSPVLQQGSGEENNSLRKIVTVDLALAAQAEKERREGAMENIQREMEFAALRPAPQPPIMTTENAMSQRAKNIKRKVVVASDFSQPDLAPETEILEPVPDVTPTVGMATSTSAELSPGVGPGEEMRRRSPRQVPEEVQAEATRPETPPRSPLRLLDRTQKSPRRPPRPASLNIDEVQTPRKFYSLVNSPAKPISNPPPPLPKQLPELPPLPQLSQIHQASPAPLVSSPVSFSSFRAGSIALHKATEPIEEASQTTDDTPVQPLERKLTPPKRMTRGAAFPLRPISRKPSPEPEGEQPASVKERSLPTQSPRSSMANITVPVSITTTQALGGARSSSRFSQFPLPNSRPMTGSPISNKEENLDRVQAPTAKQPAPEGAGFAQNVSLREQTDQESGKTGSIKKSLQRMPTTGLPSNPRARAMKTIVGETGLPREQTIMFINTIKYDDPIVVQGIIDSAKISQTPLTGNSLVNRPRPIPRKPEDHAFFTAESFPRGHCRSRSGGSIAGKNILQSNPGSPTALPPLPPPPNPSKSINFTPDRPLPNDTKSMTFHEKMTLLFPAPPSCSNNSTSNAGTNAVGNEISVPALPQIPATYYEVATSPVESGTSDGEHLLERSSKRSTKASIKAADFLGVNEIIEIDRHLPNRNKTQHRSTIDALGSSPFPCMADDYGFSASLRPSYDGAKRQSSPVIPARLSVLSNSTDGTRNDDATSHWGSIHSPAKAVNMQSCLNPRTTYIRGETTRTLPRAISQAGTNSGEVMTIKLDVESLQINDWYSESNLNSVRGSQWHHRPGDECPTFSTRKEKTRSRRMVPPTPLLLNSSRSEKKIVMQEKEPSPMQSPNETLVTIQNQLRKFEEPKRDSTGSCNSQRMTLLQSLEQEMGQLDNKWAAMQNQLGRHSMSSIQTDSRRESRRESAIVFTHGQHNPIVEHRLSRQSQLYTSNNLEYTWSTPMSVSSEHPSNSDWQAGLAQAQGNYISNALETEKKGSLNILSVVPINQLASPTPPETEYSDLESEGTHESTLVTLQQPMPMLWKPLSPAPSTLFYSLLWNPPFQGCQASIETVELPGLVVHPTLRKTAEPLDIESWSLWQKSESPKTTTRDSPMLWGVCSNPQPTVVKNRVTQRPPRRSRRVTLLPDILESPELLPDGAGALGIFQFPWGEKSDNATIQPRLPTMYTAMPGTMTSGRPSMSAVLDARSRQAEADENSSFFEDYEENDGFFVSESNSDEIERSADDDFDENTLWEIANLLNSDLPSNSYILSGDSELEDENDSDYGEESGDGLENSSFFDDEDTSIVAPLQMKQLRVAKESREYAPLWDNKQSETEGYAPFGDNEQPKAKEYPPLWNNKQSGVKLNDTPGLTQLSSWANQYFYSSMTRISRPATSLPVIESSSLWKASLRMTPTEQISALWTRPARLEKVDVAPTISKRNFKHVMQPMWSKSDYKIKITTKPTNGLPQPDKVTWNLYQSPMNSVRSPSRKAELKSVTSSSLWTPVSTEHAKFEFAPLWCKKTSKKTKVPQLWSKPTILPKVTMGLSQPHELIWSRYQPAGERSRSTFQREFGMEIKSNSLWQSSISSSSDSKWGTLWSSDASAKFSSKASTAPKRTHNTRSLELTVMPPVWERQSFPQRTVSKNGLFQLNSSPLVNYRKTGEEPVAKTMRLSRSGENTKPLESLVSNSLWVIPAVKEAPRNWILACPVVKPLFCADWDAALDEALHLSGLSQKTTRLAATSADWAAALAEAIAVSQPKISFDAAVKHPVFATSNLISASEWCHPAATGYTHDVAKRHPATFGSNSVTSEIDLDMVHPAMLIERSSCSRSSSRLSQALDPVFVPTPAVPADSVVSSTPEPIYASSLSSQIEELEREKSFDAQLANHSYVYADAQVYEDDAESVYLDDSVYEEHSPLYPSSPVSVSTPSLASESQPKTPDTQFAIPVAVEVTTPQLETETVGSDNWPLTAPSSGTSVYRSSSFTLQDQVGADATAREIEIAAEILTQNETIYGEPSPVFVNQQLWNPDRDSVDFAQRQQQEEAVSMWQQHRNSRRISGSASEIIKEESEQDKALRRTRKSAIHARIAALEYGYSTIPQSPGMWNRRDNTKTSDDGERDWLDDSTKKRFSRVELRY